MKIFNTMSRSIEEFKPLSTNNVTLYTCGPTIYNYAHIGNLRTYLFEDSLKRVLIWNGFQVKHAMNLTDIDDKTIKAGGGIKTDFSALTRKYEEYFLEDLRDLNILLPNKIMRATEYVENIVLFVEDLIKKGYAYKAEDGSTYFSIEKFKDYGKLSRLDKSGIKAGARVNQDEYDKENPSDFVLWKAWTEQDGEIFWETSLGKGRPGWHIECSAMSTDVLGNTIDIHAGAVDLIFPHHENEIAQSEARTGGEFVRYWVHGEHLMVDNQKMAKKLNNFYRLSDLKEKGFSPLDFRYLNLLAHYRTKMNFTWDSLFAAKNARERLIRIFEGVSSDAEPDQTYVEKFGEKISNDLDFPGGIAVLWEMARDENLSLDVRAVTAKKMDEALGIGLIDKDEIKIPAEIEKLAQERKKARADKDYAKSDSIRDEIDAKGWILEDLLDNDFKLIKK